MRESVELGLALLLIIGGINYFFYRLGRWYMKRTCPTLYRLSTEPEGRLFPPPLKRNPNGSPAETRAEFDARVK